MDDATFNALKSEMDRQLEVWLAEPIGITMAFDVAGEFMARGLLETIDYDVLGTPWQFRTYRNWIVYPDPSIPYGTYQFGRMVA